MNNKFNKSESEHEILLTMLKYRFALKMTTLITWAVVSVVVILGIFFGDKSLLALGITITIAIILGIITALSSFRSAMA